MRAPYIEVFKDKRLLDYMLRLRRSGWTYKSLAIVFNVDFSSIYNACKVHGVVKVEPDVILSIPNLIEIAHIPIPKKPKTYKDYLREDCERHSLLHKI